MIAPRLRLHLGRALLAVLALFPLLAAAVDCVDYTPKEEWEEPQPQPCRPKIRCIYRISGTYGAFSRWLYYSSLLSTFILRHKEWLAAGIMATAMLYSSAAGVHAWVLLIDGGSKRKILDADNIPVSTIILSTCYAIGFVGVNSTTFRTTQAVVPVIRLWRAWIMWSGLACVIYAMPAVNAWSASEVEACISNSTIPPQPTGPASVIIALIDHYNLTCDAECFRLHTSSIRGADEVFVILGNDIPEQIEMFMLFIAVGYTFAVAVHHMSHGKVSGFCIKYPLPVLTGIIAALIIALVEYIMLRRENLLKAEAFNVVGQWSVLVCVFFVVFVSLLNKYMFEPRRQAGKDPIPSLYHYLIRRLDKKDARVSSSDVELASQPPSAAQASLPMDENGANVGSEGGE